MRGQNSIRRELTDSRIRDQTTPEFVNEIIYLCDEVRDEYKMEFCDETLRKYIGKRNNKLAFATRKRITLQFLYGINYIHGQGLLHRDLSLQNVLLKVFESGAR